MYYPERSFDSDWLILLLAVVILVASVMYNPSQPEIVAEGCSKVLVVDALREDSNATLLLYLPADSTIVFPDYNISTRMLEGLHELSIPAANSIRICARIKGFEECCLVYPHAN